MNAFDYFLQDKTESVPALLTLRNEYSYGQIYRGATSIASALARSGARKGDRALLVADNTFFWVAAYLGILRAGLVCVPLAPGLPAAELQHVTAVTEPVCAFVEAKYVNKFSDLWNCRNLFTDIRVDLLLQPSVLSLADIDNSEDNAGALPQIAGNDLAALMFTSGSTGKPRGVMVSHDNIIANTNSIIEYLSLTSVDRIMAVLPFHYCFGTSLLHTHLRVGCSIVVDPRFMYPEVVLQRMQSTECTGFAGVPSHYQILLRRSNLAKMSFPKLRYVQQAGGQLAPPFIEELRLALPGKEVFIMYGQTEATARLSYLPPAALDSKLASVGRGIPGVKLSVLDENQQPVRPGETGEIVAEGENVCLGYWHDEEETGRCFRDGRLYTGDLATIDDDGFIYIVDRAKDFLKCGGKRVGCRQLENTLLGFPELLEVAVVGVPDELLGEAALAYVVLRNPTVALDEGDIRDYCQEHLPPAFVPREFVVLSGLPKSSSGKVLKALLKQRFTPVDCAK